MWQPTKLELERLQKAQRLEAKGLELYPARIERTHRIADAVASFSCAESDAQAEDIDVTVTGRIRRLNSRGKVSFRPY